jgi:two-component system, OmpR family, response regulator
MRFFFPRGVTSPSMYILLVEDDVELAGSLLGQFREQGYQVEHCADGDSGLASACRGEYQVIVLDRMLPRLDGLRLVRELRSRGVATPVIYLTTMSGIDDRVQGLEAGGDDYLVKPFAFAELLARVRVLARRPANANDAAIRLTLGSIELDLQSGSDADEAHAVGECLGHPFRPADQRRRKPHQPAASQDQSGIRGRRDTDRARNRV